MKALRTAAGAVAVLAVAACALLEPIDPATAPPGTPAEVAEGPVTVETTDGGTVTYTPPQAEEPRPTTQADVLVSTLGGLTGMLTGNPALGYTIAQLGTLVVGGFRRRKKPQPQPQA